VGLARAQEKLGRAAEAEATFEKARAADPTDWRVAQELGRFLFRAGRHHEAAAAFAEVVARAPEEAGAYANLGAARYLAGDFQGAADSLRTSLRLGPTFAALSNLGSAAFYLGQYDEAATMFRRAVELTPDDQVLWGNLGDSLTFAPGRRTEAEAAYQRAAALAERQLTINRQDDETRSDLARYQARLGHRVRARQLKDEALRRAGTSLNVQYNAALVSVELGATEEALTSLEHAVALGYQRRLLAGDAALAPLRGLPRFEALASGVSVAPAQPPPQSSPAIRSPEGERP
jgi:Flp pilus assembly protein TadD